MASVGFEPGFSVWRCQISNAITKSAARFHAAPRGNSGVYGEFIKGPVKPVKRVKIVHSFLQSVSDQFHVIILSLPM